MKHRSVIAFVIVAAALFAAPQLSHDLQTLRSALGSRLSGELMQAFLSLPSAEGAPAAPAAPLRAVAQLASCSKGRPAAKQRKSEPAPAPRAAVRAPEPSGAVLAMMIEPPVSEPWAAALPEGVPAELPRKALAERAMIIPPDSGIDPKGLARVAAGVPGVYRDLAEGRRPAAPARVSYVETRFGAQGVEWRKVENDLREAEKNLPGSFEFRLDRDGSKRRVLKVKRGTVTCCPQPAPPAPRAAGADAAAAPAPAVAALTALVSE
jgi:hypothetical protein